MPAHAQTVAVVGLGTIGSRVAAALESGIPGLALAAVAARSLSPDAIAKRFPKSAPQHVQASDAGQHADIVVDCANPSAFREVSGSAIANGRMFVTVNSATLIGNWDLVEAAKRNQARIVVPTGALLGFDAVRAAAEGEIESIVIVTRKHPSSLAGAPMLKEKNIDLGKLTAPLLLFQGSAREAAISFPQNVNVAASLSLAGIGPDRTRVEVWADPACIKNTHEVKVRAAAAEFSMTIASAPNPDNPRTGILTPLSVIAFLRSLHAPLHIGS